LGSAGNFSILEAFPETGRTHQIRVHLAALGHPVLCDSFYGSAKPVMLSAIKRGWRGDPLEERPLLSRLALHAAQLSIPCCYLETITNLCDNYGNFATTDQENGLRFTAPLSRDMVALIRQMEKAANADFGVFVHEEVF
jgi:hypothetical protein